jgi:hypothetical protein
VVVTVHAVVMAIAGVVVIAVAVAAIVIKKYEVFSLIFRGDSNITLYFYLLLFKNNPFYLFTLW